MVMRGSGGLADDPGQTARNEFVPFLLDGMGSEKQTGPSPPPQAALATIILAT